MATDDLQIRRARLTDGSHNLCLQAKLILESTGKIADATIAISGHVRDLPDVIEHLAAGEQQNGDQADGSPEVAVLHDGNYVGREHCEKSDGTHEDGNRRDNAHIVDGPNQWGLGAIRKVAVDP